MTEGVPQAAAPAVAASAPLLHAEHVVKHFYDGGRVITVLSGLELEAAAGEEIAIIGQSGVGKSTLLHVLGSLERPTAGKIFFD
ncbi:MAG: ATP-binding cassette domain-containing protein, partial [Candidatus Binataceae bacterium]